MPDHLVTPNGWRDLIPGITAVRTYQRSWFRFDLVAGLVLAAILVPQGMAYAELAGLPAVTGLYTTIACLVGYAVMGPSRILVLGPDSAVSPLIFAAIAPLVVVTSDPATAITLASMMAVMVGLILIGLGVGKLGFVADLLSKEVQVGYMNGLAITIFVGQLPKLCGFSTDADGFVAELQAFIDGFPDRNTTAAWLGLATLAILLLLPRFTRTIPAVLLAVVGATVVTGVFDLDIATVGSLPKGLPRPALPWTSVSDVAPLLVAAVGITLVSLTDTIATSTAFSARRGRGPTQQGDDRHRHGQCRRRPVPGLRRVDQQLANRRCRPDRRQEPGHRADRRWSGRSAVARLQRAACEPSADGARRRRDLGGDLARRPRDAAPLPRSPQEFAVPLTRGDRRRRLLRVLQGILIAVVLSILLFFRRNWWPHGEVLGRIDGEEGWHSVNGGGPIVGRPGIVIFRWEAPLFFANAGMFRDRVRELVRTDTPKWVVLQCEAITDIDVTAADVLEQLDLELNEQGINIAFVELRSRLKTSSTTTACSRRWTPTTSTIRSARPSTRSIPPTGVDRQMHDLHRSLQLMVR